MKLMKTQVIKINKGEEIISSLLSFCEKNKIKAAWIWGLGAISEANLAAYILKDKKYFKKKLKDNLEIASLTGNITSLEKKLVAHVHVVLSDKKMIAYGGHLNSAIVAATCEIFIQPIKENIKRKYDPHIGLNLLDI